MTGDLISIDIAVIGGGASGMMAALSAAEAALSLGVTYHICIFERNDRLGKKLLMTGNGRCNLTNTDQETSHYHGSHADFAKGALMRFDLEKTLSFFADLGVLTTQEDGKVFPISLHASSVLDALRLAVDEKNIHVEANCQIQTLIRDKDGFQLTSKDGKRFMAGTVILACGGNAAPATGSDGSAYSLLTRFSHKMIPPLPAIVQLKSDAAFCKPLTGNKVQAKAELVKDSTVLRSETGEVLFTDYGLSGPPILQLSGYVSRALSANGSARLRVRLDFVPYISEDELLSMLFIRREAFASRHLEDYLTGFFQKRLALTLMKSAIGKQMSALVRELTDEEIYKLCRAIKSTELSISGTMPFSNAQTTIGGISTNDFSAVSMESKLAKGIFACGEILDIDGDCGGYNLQWAWSSGYLAGRSAALYLSENPAHGT